MTEEEMEDKIVALADKLVDIVNEAKVHPIVALNALMRIASVVALTSGSGVEDFLKGARWTYERVMNNREEKLT